MLKASLVLVISALVLTACGGTSSNSTSPSSTADQSSLADSNKPPEGTSETSPPEASSPSQDPSIDQQQWVITALSRGPAITFNELNDYGDVLGTYPIGPRGIPTQYLQDGGLVYRDGGVIAKGTFGYFTSQPKAINNNGQIVGCGFSPSYSSPAKAFLYSLGTTTEIPAASNSAPILSSCAVNLNNAGDVVGDMSYSDAGGVVQRRAFVFANGVTTYIDPLLGGSSTTAVAINDSGTVAGTSRVGIINRAFVYSNGSLKDLGTLPYSQSSIAEDINATGAVVGTAYDTDASGNQVNQRPFLYSDGAMEVLPMLESEGTATAINDRGQVIGDFWSRDSNNAFTNGGSFLYSGGKVIDLTGLPSVTGSGWKMMGVYAINNAGQILAGGYYNNLNTYSYFLLTPGSGK